MPTVSHPTPATPPAASRCVASLDWDQVYGPDPLPAGPNGAAPTADVVARWHDAVQRAGAVVANHPDFVPEPGRFRTALDLARAKAVTFHADGTAAVRSGTHTYEIAPDCPCKDAQTVSKYCKHFLATMIQREASAQLHPARAALPQAPNGKAVVMDEAHDTPAPEAPPLAPDPFAPSTLCLKARVGDVELSWTLRGQDDDVACRAQRTLKFLDTLRGKRGDTPAPTPPPAVVPQCPLHGAVKVKASTMFSGVFCTAKLADGTYCKWTHKND